MLINKSPEEDVTAQISLAGFAPSTSAIVYSYGKPQDDAARTLNGSPDITQTVFHAASASLDYTVPPYSVTVISLLPENGDFELAVSPSSHTLNANGEASFDVGAAFANGFNEPVSITAAVDDGTPLNVSVVESNLTTSQAANLVVTARTGAEPQAYNVNVTAFGGGIERTAKLEVTVLDPPVITAATSVGKLLTITAAGLGELTRVFINGVEQTDKIKRIEGSQIVIKGKRRLVGLVAGDNRLRVVRGQAVSAEFILRL